MNEVNVELKEGWKIDDKPANQVGLGHFNVGDMLDAEEQPSDLARGLFLLARRIKSVNGLEMSLTLEMLHGLSAPDLSLLQRAAEKLDAEFEASAGLGKYSAKQG